MISNIEVTISDNRWPEMELVIKTGPHVRKFSIRCDQAESKFQSETGQIVKETVQMQIQKRKDQR